MTGEESRDPVKGSRVPPDIEEEVRERLPWWRRELLRIRDLTRARAGEEAPRKGNPS